MDKEQEKRALALQALNSAPPPGLLSEPIDYIFADHFRQRTLCRILEEVADEPAWDREKVDAALRFLMQDFALHIADEEKDLFPLLRRRADPEANIREFVGQLNEDHKRAGVRFDQIVERFSSVLERAGTKPAGQRFRELLRQFAEAEKRHLIFENAIILPLARAELTGDDLRTLGKRMADRRGLDYPELEDHAD